jgi:sirohydrochlorin ferrochelatase
MSEPNAAIVLLGHGSRLPDSGRAMEKVAQRLKDQFGRRTVKIAHMSMQQPDLDSALTSCIEQGATHVVVIPYFLHEGVHIREDVPEMMEKFAAAHPGVRLALGKGLGYDPLLADIVQKRIEAAMNGVFSPNQEGGLT